jgi:CMP-N-acetylneuraminic acid synthetase
LKILALIPARGGSKGVPRKNIRILCKKPLIQYTIDAALASEEFDEVMVSTEDYEIAEFAKELGARVPFMRPNELATDFSPTIDTVVHVIEQYKNLGRDFDAVCLLQPTNPLRTNHIISKCVKVFINSDADSLISVREVPHEFNPHWTFVDANKNGRLEIATGEKNIISRRQDLPRTYYRDGVVYITRCSVLFNQRSLYGENVTYINLENEPHINIDTMNDWKLAEKLICAE